MTLERARKVIESGIERGLHLGAQLYAPNAGMNFAIGSSSAIWPRTHT
jgi:hypothetical protein